MIGEGHVMLVAWKNLAHYTALQSLTLTLSVGFVGFPLELEPLVTESGISNG